MDNNETKERKAFPLDNVYSYTDLNNDAYDALDRMDSKYRFNYYTRQETAVDILTGRKLKEPRPFFLINSLKRMNDTHEADLYGEASSYVYALCFSHSGDESIPMWYLYSGITGKGARISLTPKKMQGLLDEVFTGGNLYAAAIEDDGSVSLEGEALRIGTDYDVQYGWVVYLGDVEILYRGEKYASLTEENRNQFVSRNFLVKDHEWNYEKEFRIIFRMRSGELMKEPPKKLALFFDKDKMLKGSGGLSIRLAPESKAVPEDFADECAIPQRKATRSRLKISMDLVSRNREGIVGQFKDVLKDLNEEKLEKIIEEAKSSLDELRKKEGK